MSVILPLFGSHRGAEALPTVARAWLGQDVACEVIVAVAGDIDPQVADGDRDGRLRIIRGPRSATAPGRLRNLAGQSARSRFLYLSDADVVPLGRDYLRRALSLLADGGKVVTQPWMYRLVPPPGWQSIRAWTPPGKHACFVTADADGVLTAAAGDRVVWRHLGLAAPPAATGSPGAAGRPERADPPEQRELPPFHWGGLLTERELFEAVGGYCPGYLGWGCEDDDLLVKLSSRREILRAWRAARTITCLHFEHPRRYGGAGLKANQALLAQREAMGAEAMILADRTRRDPALRGS